MCQTNRFVRPKHSSRVETWYGKAEVQQVGLLGARATEDA